jgi:hypothetical protein
MENIAGDEDKGGFGRSPDSDKKVKINHVHFLGVCHVAPWFLSLKTLHKLTKWCK